MTSQLESECRERGENDGVERSLREMLALCKPVEISLIRAILGVFAYQVSNSLKMPESALWQIDRCLAKSLIARQLQSEGSKTERLPGIFWCFVYWRWRDR